MATCTSCSKDMGGKPGISICQNCATILLRDKTPEELVALAKVGIDALIDEATGYQKLRPKGDLAQRHERHKAEGK